MTRAWTSQVVVLLGATGDAAAQPPDPIAIEVDLGVTAMTRPPPCAEACPYLAQPLVAAAIRYQVAPRFGLAARGWVARGGRENKHVGATASAHLNGSRWRLELGAGLVDVTYYSGDGGTLGGGGYLAMFGGAVAITRGPRLSTWLSARAMRTFLDEGDNQIGELAYGVSW